MIAPSPPAAIKMNLRREGLGGAAGLAGTVDFAGSVDFACSAGFAGAAGTVPRFWQTRHRIDLPAKSSLTS
jgi:hypothetical protein